MKKSLSIIIACAIPMAAQSASVYLADSVVSVAVFQPFTNTNLGTFGNGSIVSGVTDESVAMTFASTPAGAAGETHLNGRFEPGVTAANQTVTYGYSTPRDLAGVIIWNYNEFWTGDNRTYNERGITRADFTITHSGGVTVLDDIAITLTPDSDDSTQLNTAQQISFGGNLTGVTSIVVEDLQSNAGQAGWMDFAAVGVPEPSSTALLGLGGLALLIRRKR